MSATAIRHFPTETTQLTTLSPVQAQVVAALAQGRTVTAAARAAGIHRSTIYEWLQTVPGFPAAVDEARAEFTDTLHDDLKDLASRALSALHSILDDPKAPAGPRVRAALAVLNRPQFPNPDWHLPVSVASARQQRFLVDFASFKADYDFSRMAEALNKQAASAA
jgi:hypothetical protein